jgi:hypothetical protein
MACGVGVGDVRERDHPASRSFGATGGADQQIDAREQARQQEIELLPRPKRYQRRLVAHLERQELFHICGEFVYYDIVA